MVIKALTTGTDQASVRNPWNKTLLSYFHTWSPGNALKPIGTFNTEQGIVCFRCIATILNILFLWQWPQICHFHQFIIAIFSQADCMPTWPASVVMWRLHLAAVLARSGCTKVHQRPQDHKFISHVRNNFDRASASNPRFPWCDSNVRESVRDYQTWRPWACSKSSRHLDATFSLEHNRKPHRTGSWQARDQFNGKLAFSPAFVWVWPVWDVQQ